MPAVVQEMPDEYLFCRSLNHSWKSSRPMKTKYGRSAVYEWHITCSSCGKGRIDTIDLAGEIVDRRYLRPEEGPPYDVRGAGRPLPKSTFRIEMMHRLNPVERVQAE